MNIGSKFICEIIHTGLVLVMLVRMASMIFNCYLMRDRQCVGVDRRRVDNYKVDRMIR